MLIAVISVCPWRSCMISQSRECGCYRTIRRSIRHWCGPACEVAERIRCETDAGACSFVFALPKKERMGHTLTLLLNHCDLQKKRIGCPAKAVMTMRRIRLSACFPYGIWRLLVALVLTGDEASAERCVIWRHLIPRVEGIVFSTSRQQVEQT